MWAAWETIKTGDKNMAGKNSRYETTWKNRSKIEGDMKMRCERNDWIHIVKYKIHLDTSVNTMLHNRFRLKQEMC